MLSMALGFGMGMEMLLLIVATTTFFFFTCWEESYTGFFRSQIGCVGISEAHLLISVIFVATGIFGTDELWGVQVS
jgi:hypothetical protein